MTRRFVAAMLPFLFVLPACSGDDDAKSSTTFAPPITNPPLATAVVTTSGPPTTASGTTPTTSAPATTSSTALTVTTDATDDERSPATGPGEPDWVEIVQGLYDTLDDINADPSVARIDEFCIDVESPCRDVQGAQIEALVRDGWRVVDVPRTEVLDADVVSTVDGEPPLDSTLVILDVQVGPVPDGGRILDASGDVVFEITADSTVDGRGSWFVRHMGDGEWRVFEIT